MPTLFFSYSLLPNRTIDDPALNSPYTISHYVGQFLREQAIEAGYDFQWVNLDDTTLREFSNEDIVIGHLWDTPGSFMQQALQHPLRAKIILQPYSAGMVSEGDIPRYIDMFSKADALCFITGEYWHSTMLSSPWAALYPKVTRLDMAVDCAQHPYLKTHWNPPGKRGFLCIGADIPAKGLANVAELARVAGIRLAHFGAPNPDTFQHVPQFTQYPGTDFTPDAIARICRDYDFFISMGNYDANPTTLLETAAWGLYGLCTPQSGYKIGEPFVGLILNNMAFNLKQIEYCQSFVPYALQSHSDWLRQTMERDYTWERFTATLWKVVEQWL